VVGYKKCQLKIGIVFRRRRMKSRLIYAVLIALSLSGCSGPPTGGQDLAVIEGALIVTAPVWLPVRLACEGMGAAGKEIKSATVLDGPAIADKKSKS
jgi:hypothetical protein